VSSAGLYRTERAGRRSRTPPPHEEIARMTYVITEPCIGVKDASCVDVCPVDCIHATDDDAMYFIDPDECIDCGACEPECPVTAIFAEDAVPDQWQNFIQINADYFANK
jgi:NAD-dependent dihydropyrimidine dehydrogenase PreA subunit